jgi:hypothetical protein
MGSLSRLKALSFECGSNAENVHQSCREAAWFNRTPFARLLGHANSSRCSPW